MITRNELIEIGFIERYENDYLKDGSIGIFVDQGVVVWINQDDNYDGLRVKINSMSDFKHFLTYLG